MQALTYLTALVALLAIIAVDNVAGRNCSQAKVDLHSTTPFLIPYQKAKFQTVYTRGCSCMTFYSDFPLIRNNVQRINTFGRCVLFFQNNNCNGQADVKLFRRERGGEWLNNYGNISGNVQSFKLC